MLTHDQVKKLKINSQDAVEWLEKNHPDCPWLHYLGSLDVLCDTALALFVTPNKPLHRDATQSWLCGGCGAYNRSYHANCRKCSKRR